MLIIAAHSLRARAKERLSAWGKVIGLKTEGITYPAISSHPDIFFCQAPGRLFTATDLPEEYFEILNANGINFIRGGQNVGREYPASARYNAVATEKYLVHNFRYTDHNLINNLRHLESVQVEQGYCRCNLLPLRDDHFITSDEGIYKVLKRLHLNNLLVSPKDIQLEGFPHGFFGGCCGVWEDKVFINGSLNYYREGEKVRDYLVNLDYELVELSDHPLIDCGSIFFVG